MGAFVSLAFGYVEHGDVRDALDRALEEAGLRPRPASASATEWAVTEWAVPVAGEELAVTCRRYQEDGWVATTLDIDEAAFEAMGARHGRVALVRALLGVGARLLRRLRLPYVFFDEEAEAEIEPAAYQADRLMGITLVADDVPGLAAALRRPDVQRTERFDGGVILFRRPDPVPHYQPPR